MLWTLWDVVFPMAVAFVAGLSFGWLLWRWQRIRVSAEELRRLRRDTGRLKADNERLRDRLVDSQGRSRQRAERKDAGGRRENARTAERGPDAQRAARRPESGESRPRDRAAEPGDETATTLDSVDELRRAVVARDRMIDTLRHSLSQQQDGADSALMAAELAARERKINALEDLLSAQIQRAES